MVIFVNESVDLQEDLSDFMSACNEDQEWEAGIEDSLDERYPETSEQ